MNEVNTWLQDVFDELQELSKSDKAKFLESLMAYFTITGRAIWSDSLQTDTEKTNAFKWMNEVVHRIWNIHFELQKDQDNDSIKRLFENMKFYSEQSDLLRKHLRPTLLGALENFREKQ